MDVVVTIVAFLAVLVILVLVHELGHFVVAKLAGITVQEFGVGFPPRLASVTWRGTRYSINAIPLGGFVKMLGEDGEIEAERMRERGLSEREIDAAMVGAFNRKPIPVRLAVLFAGVAMNFLLAVVLFAWAFSVPQPVSVPPVTVTRVQADSPAVGRLEVGDQIVSADGRSFDRTTDLVDYIAAHAGSPVTLQVVRDGRNLDVAVTPRQLTEEQRRAGMGAIGFALTSTVEMSSPRANGPIDAIVSSVRVTGEIAWAIPGGLAQTVAGLIGLAPNTGEARGPIGIAQATGEMLQEPLFSQLTFIGLLSVNLAVLNVLPFPPLDGGRIAVTLIEALRRRRLPAEREALIYLTGFLVLIALVILISIQDIQRLPGG
ncbi:MAG TPA: M50 family metallopeptidase [Candidatus Limnocylindria bacterium]|jgi:regulator of sigma E protease|nr:M50 family metallopeptidase [Candidatus Limnocylindria bacterium]